MDKQTQNLRTRVSPGTAIALLALIIALSTPAHATIGAIARGSVGTAQLKDGAVTTPKLRDGAVTAPKLRAGAVTNPKLRDSAVTGRKIADGSVGLTDLAASARPQLPRALSAKRDDTVYLGSYAPYVQLTVPAGKWAIAAKVGYGLYDSGVGCYLRDKPSNWIDYSGAHSRVQNEMSGGLSFHAVVVLREASRVSLDCGGDSPTLVAIGRIVATAVR